VIFTRFASTPSASASCSPIIIKFKLRADAKFRTTVGLDRKPATVYEKVMGFGGQWEQTGTSCDKAEVRMTMSRDRSFKLRVKTTCEGQVFDGSFQVYVILPSPDLSSAGRVEFARMPPTVPATRKTYSGRLALNQ